MGGRKGRRVGGREGGKEEGGKEGGRERGREGGREGEEGGRMGGSEGVCVWVGRVKILFACNYRWSQLNSSAAVTSTAIQYDWHLQCYHGIESYGTCMRIKL